MRIASLVPSATETAFALGLGAQVVAVTHECDYPPAARELPRLTRSVIEPGLPPAAIDAAVRGRVGRGEALYELDDRLLAELDVDLIVTQAVCPVCAVSHEDVRALAARLPRTPAVLAQDPSKLDDVLDDVAELATAARAAERGAALRSELRERIDLVRGAVGPETRPRVVALEWLDPPFLAGHWVPEMIAAAGGIDALARPGERSRRCSWEEVEAAAPDLVVVMPCGLDAEAAAAAARSHAEQIGRIGAGRAVSVDAAASFSRPGPRLADGVELLGHLLHPRAVRPPDGLASAEALPTA